MNPTIGELTPSRRAGSQETARSAAAHDASWQRRGPLTALAFVLIIGTAQRFQCGKQIGSSVGLIPADATPALASSVWDTSPNKAALCCVSCWWKQRKPQRVVMRTGDDAMCI